jgi:hypothetical protein
MDGRWNFTRLLMEKIRKILNEFTGFGLGIFAGFGLSLIAEHGPIFDAMILAAAIGVGAGMMTIFIDFIIQPGQIFGWYTSFLNHVVNHPKNPFRFLFKPMGGCLYCLNTWVTFGIYALAVYHTGLTLWLILPAAAIAHVTVSILEPIVNG